MPELPEVETVRRGLEAAVVGRRLTAVRVTGRRTVRRQSPGELVARLEGRLVERADRRGKYLALPLDSGEVLVVHLRMSGQLLHVLEPDRVAPVAHTHVVAALDDGTELRFVDPRTFGEWYVTDEVRPDGLPEEFDRFGPDPVAEGLGVARLRRQLAGRTMPLKAALTDQRIVAGIGSIYADEICHLARVAPDRRVSTLSAAEERALARAIDSVLAEAVRLGGSTLSDARYVNLTGELGTYQSRHGVYGRAGEPCFACGRPVERIHFGARVAYCCRHCQH